MTVLRKTCFSLIAVALTACGGNEPIPDPDPNYDNIPGAEDGADSMGMGNSGLNDGEFFDDGMNDLTMVIYFDFDQSELRAEYGDLLSRHAGRLAGDSRMRVRLEGHADERGSREYNIGLAERRAQAVRRMLLIQGAAADQIATVSFGEERPASMGSDEESYRLNRRVEIQYTN